MSNDPVTQTRAGFVVSQLDCVLVPNAQLETRLLQSGIASIPQGTVGRVRTPWIVEGLINVLMMMSGAAFVLALVMFAFWCFRQRNSPSADSGA